MNISVVGTGYVGLVTGTCFAYLGHRVTCIDADQEKIRQLSRGEIPIHEPHLDKLLVEARRRGGIDFTSDVESGVAGREVVIIAVGTPSSPSGAADLRFLEAATRSIGRAMDAKHRVVVVNKSTVPVGSGSLVEMLVR